jgi:hypothetical protein
MPQTKDKTTPPTSNPARRLPTAQSRDKKKKDDSIPNNTPTAAATVHPPGYSAQQAAVRDMMRRALEEDQYSALGVSFK